MALEQVGTISLCTCSNLTMPCSQSSADLTLLNQSLQKARRSTDQMTTML